MYQRKPGPSFESVSKKVKVLGLSLEGEFADIVEG